MAYSGKLKYYIPKGSVFYEGKIELATTNKDFELGYVPMPEDFNPPLPFGKEIQRGIFKYKGVFIYEHPNFTDNAPTKEY